MIRPFKNIKEFVETTGFSIGSVIQMFHIPSKDRFTAMVIKVSFSEDYVAIGDATMSLKHLCEDFKYCKNDEWLPFGVEETSNRPAKFKVGKKYYCLDDYGERTAVFVTAKYKDPLDGKLKVVFDNRVCEVKTDEYDEEGEEDNNEFLSEDFLSDVIDARDEVKE